MQFPQSLNDGTRGRYLKKLSLLITKEIDITPSFNWGLASQTGVDDIRNFLQYTLLDASGVCLSVCRGWERLFRIQEPIYWEVLMEFYSIVSFDPRKSPDASRAFSVQLGGMIRECNAIEFVVRVGVYTAV